MQVMKSKAILTSLKKLRTDYLDLLLIHLSRLSYYVEHIAQWKNFIKWKNTLP